MIHFSIIIGYRNRDIERVKRSLDSLANQTFTDFEVLFIDFGSDEVMAQSIKLQVSIYPFVKYVFNNTTGLFWNRAHALNTGLRLAKGNISIFFDIDIIVEKSFLEGILALDFKNNFYTFSCFYLPSNFNFTNELSTSGVHYEQNYVGICAIDSKVCIANNSLDEFFMVWGAEDDDLYLRLEKANLKRIQKSVIEFPLFHQWHESHSPKLPSLWYITMVNYLYMSKKTEIVRNNWGRLLIDSDRPLINAILINSFKDFQCLNFDFNNPLLFNNPFIEGFHRLKENEKAYFEYNVSLPIPLKKSFHFFRYKLKKSVTIHNCQSQTINEFFMFFVGKNRHLMLDYYYQKTEKHILFVVIKK